MFQKFLKRKTNTRIFFLLVSVIIVLPVFGEHINENKAREVAAKKLSDSSTLRSADSNQQEALTDQKSLQLLYKSSSSSENANSYMRRAQGNETVYFYVFGAEDNEGFVIVSGDDRVTPILGYSYTNGFSADDMPPNLKWWLSEYARQIEFAIENNIEATAEVTQQWAQYLGINNNEKEE